MSKPRMTIALARMAVLRQAPELTELDFELYAEELVRQNVPADQVEEACQRMGLREREEGQTAFPSLGSLLKECERVRVDRRRAEIEALAATAPKALMPPENMPPLSREEAKAFVTRLRADVEAMRARH